MSKININGKDCTAYYGDHQPVSVKLGSTQLYGAEEQTKTGSTTVFENTYNGNGAKQLTLTGSSMSGATKGEQLIDWSTVEKTASTYTVTWDNITKKLTGTLLTGTSSLYGTRTTAIGQLNNKRICFADEWFSNSRVTPHRYIMVLSYTDHVFSLPSTAFFGNWLGEMYNANNEVISGSNYTHVTRYNLGHFQTPTSYYTRNGYRYISAPFMMPNYYRSQFSSDTPYYGIVKQFEPYAWRSDTTTDVEISVTKPMFTLIDADELGIEFTTSMYGGDVSDTTYNAIKSVFTTATTKTIVDKMIDELGYSLQYEPFTGGEPAPNATYNSDGTLHDSTYDVGVYGTCDTLETFYPTTTVVGGDKTKILYVSEVEDND